MNICNNSIIHVDIPETRTKADAPEAADDEFEELCLIKVYRSNDEMLFSYWTPRRTANTFASIFFKYWRNVFKYNVFKYNPNHIIGDIVPWTGLRDDGDGHSTGRCHEHWDKSSDFLSAFHATGKLGKEKMTSSLEKPDSVAEDSDDDLYSDDEMVQPLVLKVKLGGKPKNTRKLANNLSRVTLNSSSWFLPNFVLGANSTAFQLDVLKAMFDAFVNRLLAYNFSTHM